MEAQAHSLQTWHISTTSEQKLINFGQNMFLRQRRTRKILLSSGGFKVGGARDMTKKGPSDDVIIFSQPW